MNLSYKKINRVNFFLKTCNNINNSNLKFLRFGFIGIQSLSNNFLKPSQIESLRLVLSREFKTVTKLFYRIYIRVLFSYPITQKPLLTRMGKGSGSIKDKICIIRKGQVFLEINTRCSFFRIKPLLNQSLYKIPFLRTAYVFR